MMENPLPLGWAMTTLGEVLPLSYGKSLVEKVRDANGNIPVYGSSGMLGRHCESLLSQPSLIVGRKGNVGSVYFSDGPCWVIDTAYFSTGSRLLHLPYFRYLLETLRLAQLDKSTAVPGLSRDDYSVVPVAIPGHPEQRRIVAEIEKQLTCLDAAVAALKRVQANLKRYRASVLKAACEGRLVQTEAELARKEGCPYETGEQLLARILKERRAKWEAGQLTKMLAAGKPPKDNDWKKKYKDPAPPDTTSLPELPEGWAWATLEQLTSLVTSGSRGWAEYYSESGPLFIRAQDINTDRLELNAVAHVALSAASEGTRTRVYSNDLLVTITGANVTKSALVNIELDEAYVSQHVALIRPVIENLGPYLYTWVVSPAHGRKVLEIAAYGAGKPGLNLDHLRSLVVALPPIAEQLRIQAELSTCVTVADSASSSIVTSCKRASRLRQSILKRAFEGKLVPQDPNDEPAAVLLERIRAERSEKQPVPRTIRGPRTRKAKGVTA